MRRSGANDDIGPRWSGSAIVSCTPDTSIPFRRHVHAGMTALSPCARRSSAAQNARRCLICCAPCHTRPCQRVRRHGRVKQKPHDPLPEREWGDEEERGAREDAKRDRARLGEQRASVLVARERARDRPVERERENEDRTAGLSYVRSIRGGRGLTGAR
jgi:hypothetical protein